MTAPTPAIPSFADGTVPSAATYNGLPSHLTNLYNYTQGGFRTIKPLCLVTAASGNVATSFDTLIAWQSVYANTDNMFATSTKTQITIRTAGWYRLALEVHYDAYDLGIRACKIMMNGVSPGSNAVATDCREQVNAEEGGVVFCTALVSCAKGTVFYANTWQNSGVTKALAQYFAQTFFSAEWISPL